MRRSAPVHRGHSKSGLISEFLDSLTTTAQHIGGVDEELWLST